MGLLRWWRERKDREAREAREAGERLERMSERQDAINAFKAKHAAKLWNFHPKTGEPIGWLFDVEWVGRKWDPQTGAIVSRGEARVTAFCRWDGSKFPAWRFAFDPATSAPLNGFHSQEMKWLGMNGKMWPVPESEAAAVTKE